MPPTKTQAEPQNKAAAPLTTAKQPEPPIKKVGSTHAAWVQRAADALPPPNGRPSPVRAADLMDASAPATGTIRRAHMMTNMQQTVGNARIARMVGPVVQHEGVGSQVRRAPGDFQVRRPFTPPASEATRWQNFVFFDLASSTLDVAQKSKVDSFAATLAGNPTLPVTLGGFASEEGDAAFNTQLVNDRIEAVAQILIAKGHAPGSITRQPRPTAAAGQIAYRRWRAVEMLQGSAVSSIPDCSTTPQTTSFSIGQTIGFNLAKVLGITMLDSTARNLRMIPSPPAATLGLARRLFGSAAPLDQIADNLDKIKGALAGKNTGNTTLGTACHRSCQGGTLAFVNSGTDRMTLCAAFFDADMAQRIRILIHEASHIQPGLGVTDRAYGWERLVNILGRVDPAQALNNADSYTLLVLGDNGVTGVSGTVAPTDDLSALPPGDRTKAEVAFAHLQRWNTRSGQQATALYNRINHGISADSWTEPAALADMQFIASHFGTTVRTDKPQDRDRATVAAIYDRFAIMGRALKQSIKVTVAGGNTSWKPGPGDEVAVAPSLWGQSVQAQVRMLLRRLAAATPDISPGHVSAYVELSDRFRQQRGEGP